MMSSKTEEGIERLIKYIRRMNSLDDARLRLLLGAAIEQNPDSYTSIGVDIPGHIAWIRRMALLNDEQMRAILLESSNDPVMQEIYEDAAKKKALIEMQNIAKDIKSSPTKFARKVI
jgi:hypothetical protein